MFGHEKRQRRDDNVMPYGLTPGQTFDVADSGIDVSNFLRGNAGPVSWGTAAFAGLDVAISSGTAPRGEFAGRAVGAAAVQATNLADFYIGSSLVKASAGSMTNMAVGLVGGSRAVAAAETLGGVELLGTTVGGILSGGIGLAAGLALSFAIDPMIRKISKPVNRLVGESQRRVNFGGFQDSIPAFTMRQRALREMQGSLLNATQYLGREAQLMHQ
jgi:hypothetical protein